MRPKILLLIAVLISFSSCNAQEKESKKNASNADKGELNKPDASWKVNREYDENGNLISYDSTYVYSYSNVEGDTLFDRNMEEMILKFHRYLENQGMREPSFFFNDSLNNPDNFFHDQFFSHRYLGDSDLLLQMRQMDSLHQEFLKKYFPQYREEENRKMIPRKEGTNSGAI